MAIKISGSTIIDDSRGIVNAGISTFNNDVTFLGASYNATWDKSDNSLIFDDDAKAKFGTGGDLEIFHNGSDGRLVSADTIRVRTPFFNIQNNAGNENIALFYDDADGVHLYNDNALRFQTTSTGAKITGDLTLEEADNGTATALPEFKLFKNSSSVNAADYLGQIKFAGNSSSGTERNYAKITAKVLDSTNGSEDGALEFAHIKAGSQTITGRWRSDSLQLLNGTALTVAGTTTVTGNILPSQDSNTDIGSNGVRFANIYADTLYGDASNLTGVTASNITVADESSDTQNFLVFTNSATGNQAPKTGSNLTFNASSGLLYATQFVGDGSSLTNVNATTFTVTPNNSANETVYLLFADGNSGSQGAETDTNLTYNPSNDTLTAVTFSGAHSGNGAALTNLNASNISSGTINDAYLPGTISSDITGTASFINVTANNTANEQVYLLFADGTSGTQGAETDSLLNYNPSTDVLSAQAFSGSGASLTFLNANNIASGTLAIARGGTNGSATPTAGAIAYGSGSAYLFNSQGTSGQVLLSGGSGAPTWGNTSGLTVGNATNITLADESSDTTCFPIFATSATGNQPPKTDSSALTYNASSGQLSATSFVGDGSQLTGIVAGITPTENTVDQAQPIPFFVGTAQTSLAGISTQNFVFNPSTTRLGIGTDSPSKTLEVKALKGQGPTFVNSVTQNGGTELTLTGIQSGDLVLFMGIADSYTVPTPQTDSSNWTAVPGITNNNTSAPYRAIFYKFATGSSITATFTSTNVGYAMLAYRFVDSSTPFDVNVTSNSSSGMPDCPSITPVSDKSLIIAAGFLDDDAVGSSVSAPTGYTLAVASSNTLNPSTLMVAHKLLPEAAAEDPGVFTDSSGSGSDSCQNNTLALRFNAGVITNDFKFGGDGIEVSTDDFVIDSSRNVGIKTNSPDADLHVDGTLLVSPPTNLDDSIPHFQINNTGIITSLFSVSNNQVLIDIDTTVSGILTANNFDFNNSTDGFINAGIITASEYNGDGSKLTKIPLEFYAGITSSNHFAPTSYESTVFTFPSTAGKQYVIESINVANTETSVGVGTTVNIIASIEDASAAEQTYIAYNVPITNGGTIELIRNPIVAGPSDVMKMWVTDQSYIGITTAAEVYMNFTEFTSSEYISKFAGPTTINTTAPTTLYTSTGNPTMLQRIGFVNRTDSGDYPVSIRVTSGLSTTYLVKDLIIPRYSTVDILDRYKRIETDAKLEVEVGSTGTIDVIVSGRKIL